MNVLLIYPEAPHILFNLKHTLRVLGKKALLPPVGLLTAAFGVGGVIGDDEDGVVGRIGRFGGEGTGGQSFFKAGELGFEPRLKESESFVLPLHHSPRIDSDPRIDNVRPWPLEAFNLSRQVT